ncbi:alpha-1,2-fucosyltransferase [bacterium]|nr:alpha-1,2-fucosyltransferase [bacterium]
MLKMPTKAIYLRISDGLGNQMFQYAAGRALAVRNQAELVLEPAPEFFKWHGTSRRFALPHFKLSKTSFIVYPSLLSKCFPKRENDSTGVPTLKELNAYQYQKGIAELKAPARIHGFFQSSDYFADLSPKVLIEDFGLKEKLSPEGGKLKNQVLEATDPVCLHIRLGDYKKSGIFRELSPEYYRAALAEVQRHLPEREPPIWVFSNGTQEEVTELCKKIGIANAKIHTEKNLPEWELIHIMAGFRHHVTANSTFSWWGAWLKGSSGITTTPKQWFNEPSWEAAGLRVPGWVVI